MWGRELGELDFPSFPQVMDPADNHVSQRAAGSPGSQGRPSKDVPTVQPISRRARSSEVSPPWPVPTAYPTPAAGMNRWPLKVAKSLGTISQIGTVQYQ